MTDFTKPELQKIMAALNSWGELEGPDADLRKKVEEIIAEYSKPHQVMMGGHLVTVVKD